MSRVRNKAPRFTFNYHGTRAEGGVQTDEFKKLLIQLNDAWNSLVATKVATGPVLQAPNGSLWQLGITDFGEILSIPLTTSAVVVIIFLEDSGSGFWQLKVNNEGELTTTSVGSNPVSVVALFSTDGNGFTLGVNTEGDLLTTAI